MYRENKVQSLVPSTVSSTHCGSQKVTLQIRGDRCSVRPLGTGGVRRVNNREEICSRRGVHVCHVTCVPAFERSKSLVPRAVVEACTASRKRHCRVHVCACAESTAGLQPSLQPCNGLETPCAAAGACTPGLGVRSGCLGPAIAAGGRGPVRC